MKKFHVFVSVIFSFLYNVNAQDTSKYYLFKKDTINIHGVVYNDLGKPAADVFLFFRGKTYPQPTKTDYQGRFKIDGASFNDTITVSYYIENVQIINNGSRYLEISLPSNRRNFSYKTLDITAKRKYPKKSFPNIKLSAVAGFPNYLKLAEFPGGDSKFNAFIKSQTTYPEKAIENNIEGEVKVSFIVGENGTLKNAEIVRGIGYGCDEQIIKAVRNSPRWKPAIFMGNSSSMPSSITINFKLTDK